MHVSIKKLSLSFSLVPVLLLIFIQPIQAQNSILDKLEVGASLNYSTLHFDSDFSSLNDAYSYAYGFQAHAFIHHQFSPKFSLQTGLEYFFFTYEFEDQTTLQTGQNGGLTGNYYIYSIEEGFNTSYLSVPIYLQYRPFSNTPLYAKAGTELSYKIGYKNGVVEFNLYTEDGELREIVSRDEYDVPEAANDFLLSGVAGIGYDMHRVFPITVELKAKHSITTYLDPDDYIDSWIRSFSLSVSYHL